MEGRVPSAVCSKLPPGGDTLSASTKQLSQGLALTPPHTAPSSSSSSSSSSSGTSRTSRASSSRGFESNSWLRALLPNMRPCLLGLTLASALGAPPVFGYRRLVSFSSDANEETPAYLGPVWDRLRDDPQGTLGGVALQEEDTVIPSFAEEEGEETDSAAAVGPAAEGDSEASQDLDEPLETEGSETQDSEDAGPQQQQQEQQQPAGPGQTEQEAGDKDETGKGQQTGDAEEETGDKEETGDREETGETEASKDIEKDEIGAPASAAEGETDEETGSQAAAAAEEGREAAPPLDQSAGQANQASATGSPSQGQNMQQGPQAAAAAVAPTVPPGGGGPPVSLENQQAPLSLPQPQAGQASPPPPPKETIPAPAPGQASQPQKADAHPSQAPLPNEGETPRGDKAVSANPFAAPSLPRAAAAAAAAALPKDLAAAPSAMGNQKEGWLPLQEEGNAERPSPSPSSPYPVPVSAVVGGAPPLPEVGKAAEGTPEAGGEETMSRGPPSPATAEPLMPRWSRQFLSTGRSTLRALARADILAKFKENSQQVRPSHLMIGQLAARFGVLRAQVADARRARQAEGGGTAAAPQPQKTEGEETSSH
ncbi:hypothetical protein ACSSS7_007470 [Eimeria intestinalis]